MNSTKLVAVLLKMSTIRSETVETTDQAANGNATNGNGTGRETGSGTILTSREERERLELERLAASTGGKLRGHTHPKPGSSAFRDRHGFGHYRTRSRR